MPISTVEEIGGMPTSWTSDDVIVFALHHSIPFPLLLRHLIASPRYSLDKLLLYPTSLAASTHENDSLVVVLSNGFNDASMSA